MRNKILVRGSVGAVALALAVTACGSSGGPGSVAVGRAAGQADTWPSAIGCDGLGGMVRPCSRLTANAQVLR